MGLPRGVVPQRPTLTDLPAEIRGRIWEYALNLDEYGQGHLIEIQSTRTITRNANAADAANAPIDVITNYFTTETHPTPQNPLPLLLLTRQTEFEVKALLARTKIYRRGLKTLVPYSYKNLVPTRQASIYFHPVLDTIFMGHEMMMNLHADTEDVFEQDTERMPDEERWLLLGLEDVRNVAFEPTMWQSTDREDVIKPYRKNLRILEWFIPKTLIPELFDPRKPPPVEGEEPEPEEEEEDEDEYDGPRVPEQPYLPNATKVSFLGQPIYEIDMEQWFLQTRWELRMSLTQEERDEVLRPEWIPHGVLRQSLEMITECWESVVERLFRHDYDELVGNGVWIWRY